MVHMVFEVPFPSIPMVSDTIDKSKYFKNNGLIYKFNDFLLKLVDIREWITSTWKLEIKE
jgi:hypothetical protein